MLIMSSNTMASNNCSGDPKSWQAMTIMAWEPTVSQIPRLYIL